MTNVGLTRMRHKGSTDRSLLHTLLDGSRVGHFALIVDGSPVVLPTAIARDGDRVLAHGSTGSPWLRALADGVETSLAVTVLDSLVVARSAFESSMNFRSAVVPMLTTYGTPARAPDLRDGIEMPPSVRRMLSPRPSPDANTP
ncbi:hypothetical protein ABIB25_004647 [Nakamurella sp. UYEF19]|uniref:pyridoxamine 5'-phosphate oxidase family protein n=1 Tax=Nakamurella sp. UYEF19 TaxID=1756392 RepID=UPI003392A768